LKTRQEEDLAEEEEEDRKSFLEKNDATSGKESAARIQHGRAQKECLACGSPTRFARFAPLV
jgi:hypothetical protein